MPKEITHQPVTDQKLAEMLAIAAKVDPPVRTSLKGQAEVALLLRDRGFGPTAIARFLATHGTRVSVPTVWQFLRDNPPANS